MISTAIQALDPFFSILSFFLTLPWTIWDRVTKIIRSTISLNGYTAMEPDGVLEEKEDHKEDGDETEEEGESKEENWGFRLHR